MGGEHKCPLCSATFTRPQHVGRHLRAHTGDRPYECKECPLRFARSDLLSRHVNKAHKPPDENGKPPAGKKGRRKSMPSGAQPQVPTAGASASTEAKVRRASMDVTKSDVINTGPSPNFSTQNGLPPQPSGPPQQPAQPPLQAQRMYPHHPLLAGTPPTMTVPMGSWSSSPPTNMMGMSMPNFSAQYVPSPNMMPQTIGPNGYVTFQPPFTAMPMRMSGSDQGNSMMGRAGSMGTTGGLSNMGYEFGFKKRACDQCNHSKVRCDFAEPCHRCAHRNLRCTYNKPQKSRSIPSIPNQRLSMPMSANNSGQTNSASPQSQYSSPHSTTSPLTTTMPPPAMATAQPIYATVNDPTFMYNQNWQNEQWQNFNAPMDQSLGLIQQNANLYPQTTQPGVQSDLSGQFSTMPLPHRNSESSTNSPQNRLGSTPSLTSHATSPSSSNEPAERRHSSISFQSGWADTKGKTVEESAITDGYLPNSVSPSNVNAIVNFPQSSTYQPDPSVFAWVPPVTATIDPRMQFRNSVGAEDEEGINASRPSSSSASTYKEGQDEAAISALNERRRSSVTTGVWANAFNQMSIHDPASAIAPDPYTASQIAQASARRPSFPFVPAPSNGNVNKMPSTSNVNELWKLFMAEPISASMAHSSSTDYIDPSSNAAITPRPAMGSRGLSKSNSMPDLTSPLNGNQQFFPSFMNGITPKPTLPQASYTQPQVPEGASKQDDEHANDDNGITMKRWKDSIKTRQASFEFGSQAHAKLKSTSPPNTTHLQASTGEDNATEANAGHHAPPSMGVFNPNRPLASVLQHSSALQQTLAPERVPSFGFDNLSTPTKNAWMSRQNAAKFSSALARPGNKRLASQTLVPAETGKKVELDGASWDGSDVGLDARAFALPSAFSGLGTGMTPNVVGGNQYFAWNPTPNNPV